MADAVIAMTGILLVCGLARSCFKAAIPSIPGSWMSMRTRAGDFSRASLSPSSAVSLFDGLVALNLKHVAHELSVLFVVFDYKYEFVSHNNFGFSIHLSHQDDKQSLSKIEIRISKSETNRGQVSQNPSNSKTTNPNQGYLEHCVFCHLNLFRISCFGFSL
jgi:hypothetical protein